MNPEITKITLQSDFYQSKAVNMIRLFLILAIVQLATSEGKFPLIEMHEYIIPVYVCSLPTWLDP